MAATNFARKNVCSSPRFVPLLLIILATSVLTLSATEDFPPLFPFLISYDGPNNASSIAHLLDAPAGKHGFIRAENDQFVNDAGPVRLHGTNLTGPANFPTHAQSDRLAARLARFGINCVRLHHMDTYQQWLGIIAKDPTTQRHFNPAQMERLDYMIAAFKKRGIYVNINLHVGRWWDERDGFTDKDKRPLFDKGLDNFEPRMIELQKEYAKELLTHVNRYTGLTYANDPCVATVELNNEAGLLRWYFEGSIDKLPAPYAAEFRKQWNNWLRAKYSSTTTLRQSWKWVSTHLSNEQIPEGTFDQPLVMDGKHWIFATNATQATYSASNGVLKIVVPSKGNDLFPKLLRNLSVEKDQLYTLSFKARCVIGPEDATLGVAIADVKTGWQSLGVHQTIRVSSAWKTFSYVFRAENSTDKAQFQLTRFKVGKYEIGDVSFQGGGEIGLDLANRLEDGTIPTIKLGSFAPRQVICDFYQFLVDTERKYWLTLYAYLKHDLRVKSLVAGTQISYSAPYIQTVLDYVDDHDYWCPPGALPNSSQILINNASMVNSLDCIKRLASCRVLGKPYTISEYNHPFPNQYGAEAQPMLRAYGRLQGWSGVFEYTYNHQPEFEPNITPYPFAMIARTDVLAHFPACAAIFLRGDVQEAKSTIVAAIDYPMYFDRLTRAKSNDANIGCVGLDARLALLHKTAVDLSGKLGTNLANVENIPSDQRILVSDTGELTWNFDQPGASYLTIDTPNTKLFTGFPKGRTIRLDGVTIAVDKTRLGWATISLVSRHATGFGELNRPANILLAATGLSENKGMEIVKLANKAITLRDNYWGEGSVLVEGISATVTLPADPGRLRCFALDPSGHRKKDLPIEKAEHGGSRIVLKPEYQTVWYEIDIR